MKFATLFAALAILLAGASFAPPALEAQQTVRCESSNNRQQTCRVPNLDETSVRMVERLSGAPCVNGQSWGTEPGLVWVRSGCRAVFEYRTFGSSGGGGNQVRCESNNNRVQNCSVPNLDQTSVQLTEQLSSTPCVNGRTWGTQPNVIWVGGGCRAVFQYATTRSSRRPSSGQGTRQVRCESNGQRLQNCRVPGLDETSVRLVERLSGAPCVNGQSWGTQPDLIWVESGCRAVFEYRTMAVNSQASDNRRVSEIRCESRDNRRQECVIGNLDLSSVDLEQTLSQSPCINGTSWGTGRNPSGSRLFIWVSGGCRGVFSYRTN